MTEADELRQYDGMVQTVTQRFVRKLPVTVLREDIEAAGRLGLLLALRRIPTRGPEFEAYAWGRIRGAILDELRLQDWSPRRSGNYAGDKAPNVFVSETMDENEAATEVCEEIDRRLDLERACSRLPDRLRRIVEAYYGQEVQIPALSVELGVSQARISQLRAQAIQRLRVALKHQ